MAISISISSTVQFKVKGSIKDAAGVDQPFSFGLTCDRVPEEDITARMKGFDGTLAEFAAEFLLDVIQNWSDVLDAEKKPVPFSRDAWLQLHRAVPGLSHLTLAAYRQESGAKAKN